MSNADPNPAAGAEAPRERLFTWPLTAFLVAVGLVVVFGLRSRFPTPDVAGAVELLADGDLDGEERLRMLRITLEGALRSEVLRDRWAGLLAAVALEERDAFGRLRAALGPVDAPAPVPPPEQRELLGLGDPLIGNVLAAMVAEAERDGPRALHEWQQVAAQAHSRSRPFAAELAAVGERRHR